MEGWPWPWLVCGFSDVHQGLGREGTEVGRAASRLCPDQPVGRCAGEEEQAKLSVGAPPILPLPCTSILPASKALGFHPENGCGALKAYSCRIARSQML